MVTVKVSYIRGVVVHLCSLLLVASVCGGIGADVPWTSYEAESMETDGEVIGPDYAPNTIKVESSDQKCVRLSEEGNYVEFTASEDANSMVVRYNLPDAPGGGGLSTVMELRVNGVLARTLDLDSKTMWLYGRYPFTNNPSHRMPRNFYDEARVKGLVINVGDTVRIQKTKSDGVSCIVDLVDLELVPNAIEQPVNSLSVVDYGAVGDGVADDTQAVVDCLVAAREQGKAIYVPQGDFKMTRDVVVRSDVTVQGAGMWYTNFVGDENVYSQVDRRVRFDLAGSNIRLSDFAITGALDYRNDSEQSDGIVSDFCSNVEISNIWVEHTKVGVWVNNADELTISNCRFRNLLADGTNFCVSTSNSVVDNCTARGTGDDCFAMWPAVFDTRYLKEGVVPGNNVIRNCTGGLNFLANGAALYGGQGNRVENCLFKDVGAGSGILISTTFPTALEDQGIDHNFAGKTYVDNVKLVRSGGYDHAWKWRGAMQVCIDGRDISGLVLSGIEIVDSLSDGLLIVGPGAGVLSDSSVSGLRVRNSGLGGESGYGLHVRYDAEGAIRLFDSSVESLSIGSVSFVVERAVSLDWELADSGDRLRFSYSLDEVNQSYFEQSEDLQSWERFDEASFPDVPIELRFGDSLTELAPRRFFRAWERLEKR